MKLHVLDNTDKSRYEIQADGDVAGFIDYKLSHNGIAFLHAETDQRFRGKGVAGRLAQAALDSARERGLPVLPYCPFVLDFIGEHPEYAELVPADRRSEFGL